MKLQIKDQDGNMLSVNGFAPTQFPIDLRDVEPSRLEGLYVALSQDSESIILTLTLETA